MKKKIINNWVHNPGKHCASTALSDLSYFYTRNYPEHLTFGLGSGLGFFYLKADYLTPSRAIYTRSAWLEKNFFENHGVPFEWKKENDSNLALEKVKEFIDKDIPVLLQTDLYYIDYYNSSTHFNGHIVVMWGYDDEKEVAFLGDTHWEGLKEISYESLKKARTSQFPPFPLENNYFPVPNMDFRITLKDAMKRALIQQAEYLLKGEELPDFSGIKGMRKVAEELLTWQEQEDFSWCVRFAYQVIERRGTGGGAFRFLYADFLKECEMELPPLKYIRTEKRMRTIAEKWRELAYLLKDVSEGMVSLLEKALRTLSHIADEEEKLFSDILNELSE